MVQETSPLKRIKRRSEGFVCFWADYTCNGLDRMYAVCNRISVLPRIDMFRSLAQVR